MRGRILNPAEDGVLVEMLPEAESPACSGNDGCHGNDGCRSSHSCGGAGCPATTATTAAAATMAAEATTAAAGSAEYGLCGPAYPEAPVLVRVKKGEQAEYSPGQIVELRRGGLASQTAAALLPPVAGFVLGYALAGLPAPDSGVQAGAGLILMFALALGFYLFRRRRQPRLFFTIRRPALNRASAFTFVQRSVDPFQG